jgi:CRP-like cAMP-binding protein
MAEILFTAPPAPLAALIERSPTHHFAIGAALLTPGERSNVLWCIQDGLVRMYALDPNGNNHNLGFFGAGRFVSGQLTLRNGQICCGDQALGVAALIQTTAVAVPLDAIEQLRQQHTEVADWVIAQLLERASSQQRQATDLLQRSATDRYLDLLQTQPDIAKHVALHQIAGWLGITPVALSRIRRKLKALLPQEQH